MGNGGGRWKKVRIKVEAPRRILELFYIKGEEGPGVRGKEVLMGYARKQRHASPRNGRASWATKKESFGRHDA